MKLVALLLILVLAVVVVPAMALAQSLNGSIYQVQGSSVSLMFSVVGQTFVTTILSFGNGGNGRWFAAAGTTDGVSGTGEIIVPSVFSVHIQPGGSFQFQLDQAGSAGGSVTITGLGSLIPISSGRLVRVFP